MSQSDLVPLAMFVAICVLMIWVGSHETKEERDYEAKLQGKTQQDTNSKTATVANEGE